MKRFKKFLKESISYTYKIPKNGVEKIADFYTLEYLKSRLNKEPQDAKAFLRSGNLEDLRDITEDGFRTLTKDLYDEMLDCVFAAIVSEIRHIALPNLSGRRGDPKVVDKMIDDDKYFKAIRDFYIENSDGPKSRTLGRAILTKKPYLHSVAAAIEKGKLPFSKEKFVRFASKMFIELPWRASYGQEPWKLIADGYLTALKIGNSRKEIAVDHMIDLQHNTGSVLDKTLNFRDGKIPVMSLIELKSKESVKLEDIAKFSSIPKRILMMAYNILGISKIDSQSKVHPSEIRISGYEWVRDAMVSDDALVSYDKSNGLVWHKGEWIKGIWKDGVWESGVWKGGTWEDGEWLDGEWLRGTWENGVWHKGVWNSGFWKNGEWDRGVWHGGEWSDGIWSNGLWSDGVWKGGTWEDGEWSDGTWEGGRWEAGTFEDGVWQNGTWMAGTHEGGFWVRGVWKDGEWFNGHWSSGEWWDGNWYNGRWDDGFWYYGQWYDGEWNGGQWRGGTWKTGKINGEESSEPPQN